MDRDRSDELTSRLPIVPHEAAGVDCCGCIIASVDGTNVELRCNECGAVMGVLQIDVLKGLLGLESAAQTCPHCGTLNTAPGFRQMKAYVCANCGKAVEVQQELEWVEIEDDTCSWYEFSDGREPIPVMRCNRCDCHPAVDEDGVRCPLCGRRSKVRAGYFIAAIEAWNAMVDPGGE
jgi:hypothetical protein